MYAVLDAVWKPTADQTTPPRGKAPAVVRNDPYTHGFVIAGGWATLGAEEFVAQIRTARLTGATAGAATADFEVRNERGVYDPDTDEFTETVDGPDLRIVIGLTDTQTNTLPAAWFWDCQQVGGSTLVAGKGKTLDDVTRAA